MKDCASCRRAIHSIFKNNSSQPHLISVMHYKLPKKKCNINLTSFPRAPSLMSPGLPPLGLWPWPSQFCQMAQGLRIMLMYTPLLNTRNTIKDAFLHFLHRLCNNYIKCSKRFKQSCCFLIFGHWMENEKHPSSFIEIHIHHLLNRWEYT